MEKISLSSLRSRAIFLVLLAILPILALTLYSYFDQRDRAIREVQRNELVTARNLAISLEGLITSSQKLLMTVAQLPQVQRLNREGCNALFAQLMEQDPRYNIIVAADLEGQLVASAPLPHGPVNYADRRWFQQAVQTRAFSFGEIVLGRVSGRYNFNTSYPIQDDKGRLRGVISASIDIERLGGRLAKSDLPPTTAIVITDSSRKIVFRWPEPLRYTRRMLPDFLVQAMSHRDEGVDAGIGFPGDPRLFAFARLSPPWQDLWVIIGLPRDWAVDPVNRTLHRNLIWLSLVALFAIAAAWYGADFFMVRPVRGLLGVTRRLAAGDLSVRAGPGYAAGEMGLLAHSFDQMATSLQGWEVALKESEEQFRTMANAIPQLAWIAESDGFIYWYNQRWYDYTGTTQEDMKGWGWQSVHDPMVLPEVLEQWRASLATGQPFDMVFPLRGADGQFRQFLTRVLPLKDANGQVIKWFGTNTDITERQQAEEALRVSEERLRLAQKAAKVGVWDWKPKEQTLEWTPELADLYGLQPGTILSYQDWSRLVHPEDLSHIETERDEAIAQRNPFNLEFRILHASGETRWMQALGGAIYNEDGTPKRIFGINIDITRRKLLEQTLRESREDLNRAQAVAHTGSWRLDLRRNELLWSKETYLMFGIAPGTPMTYEAFLSAVHPEDREFVDREWTTAMHGQPYDIEHRIVVGDAVKWVRERTELEFDQKGQLLGGFGTVQDITDRKHAEEALRQSEAGLAEAQRIAHLGNWELDISRNKVTCSDEVYRIFGLAPQEFCPTLEDFRSFINPDDLLVVNHQLEEGMKSGNYGPYDYRIVRRDGSMRYIHARGQTHFNQEGRPLRMLGTLQDITELKQTEEALRQAQHELEQRVEDRTAELKKANQALRQSEGHMRYLASELITAQEKERQHLGLELHDDFGQLLMVLKFDLRAIQKAMPPESVGIRDDLENALNFINEIVERVRRLSRNLRPTVLEDMGLSTSLRLLFEDFRKHHSLELTEDIDDVQSLFSLEAQLLIYRIFQESLTNVAKHAGAAAVVVSIKKQDGIVDFQVEDNGRGFNLQQVLEEDSYKGLGLASVKERVQILGGDMDLWSQPGHGTRIRFSVPVTNPNL